MVAYSVAVSGRGSVVPAVKRFFGNFLLAVVPFWSNCNETGDSTLSGISSTLRYVNGASIAKLRLNPATTRNRTIIT